jgi:phosphoribosylaminoimidazole carboxylase PurE protein
MKGPQVSILMGSQSDAECMAKASVVLDEFGVTHETRVLSAHRQPDAVVSYAREARERGVRVLIAGAGLAAHLPGVLVSHTGLPVIGVPIASGSLGGLDALLSEVQMPPGVPVATVGINNATNAAHLAVRILALSDPALGERLAQYREALAQPRAT